MDPERRRAQGGSADGEQERGEAADPRSAEPSTALGDELYVLGLVGGLCSQPQRDEVVLTAALSLLRTLQQKRRDASRAREGRCRDDSEADLEVDFV
ncbi:MAG: hypothetical protein KDK91_00265 [Gammaproteobacteria bacterium]|nr:hypothetical protein [Gammaproteobacteria bacterium]